jgi:outer membrane protein OmpA-like peptidoglycan-associated protein
VNRLVGCGYTDSVGGKNVNERVGLERAENVKRSQNPGS